MYSPTDIHKQDIVHTDIKTENVVLSLSFSHLVKARWKNSTYQFTPVSTSACVSLSWNRRESMVQFNKRDIQVKIIDLAEARPLVRCGFGLVGSNQYRAPEITLGTWLLEQILKSSDRACRHKVDSQD